MRYDVMVKINACKVIPVCAKDEESAKNTAWELMQATKGYGVKFGPKDFFEIECANVESKEKK